jgi:hypothetical protein
LKRKIGYDDINDNAEKKLAEKQGIQSTMEPVTKELAGKLNIQAMQIDREEGW